ncbi:MAG: metallophosphoesterase [Dyadobacter sp.]|uniref:metallophosphoesterase n=1 Tax=Dyadobacter sp. TaxID=1914288 RepID=UPI003263B9C9
MMHCNCHLIFVKYLTVIALVLVAVSFSVAQQDSVRRRIILIGDAGEINPKQSYALHDAAGNVIAGKTTVMFLGDNVYPHGIGLPGSADESVTQQILRAQFEPMRAKGAPVYFVPGNHDWDRSGRDGLARIRQMGEFLRNQQDPGLTLVPPNGCPDPVAINLGDSVVVIAFDSEWWLFPYLKTDTADACSCHTKEEVLSRMQELKTRNAGKFILLASHHPFQSYGTHGGKYSLKDHIFPLTAVKKWLYIPLPVIGSLYPALRTIFRNPEDLGHTLYKDMISKVGGVFEDDPNVVFVAGHEHGLQLIRDKRLQVVSGSGSKRSFAKMGKHSLFSDTRQGFVTIDLLGKKELRITYYALSRKVMGTVFDFTLPFREIK